MMAIRRVMTSVTIDSLRRILSSTMKIRAHADWCGQVNGTAVNGKGDIVTAISHVPTEAPVVFVFDRERPLS